MAVWWKEKVVRAGVCAVGLLTALLTGRCGVVTAMVPTGHVAPSRLALRLTDVPPGFTQTAGQAIAGPQANKSDGFPPGTLERHGWLGDYKTKFQRAALIGLLEIDDLVVSYGATTGAEWALNRSLHIARTQKYSGSFFKPMSVGHVGSETYGFEWTGTSKGYKLTLVAVLFRQGAYTCLVEGGSLADPAGPDTVIRLAGVVASRIRAIG